jgi:hypothetical protein
MNNQKIIVVKVLNVQLLDFNRQQNSIYQYSFIIISYIYLVKKVTYCYHICAIIVWI